MEHDCARKIFYIYLIVFIYNPNLLHRSPEKCYNYSNISASARHFYLCTSLGYSKIFIIMQAFWILYLIWYSESYKLTMSENVERDFGNTREH